MAVSFPFRKEHSSIFSTIHRPIAEVSFKHTTENIWQPISMIVDTGADYTILPRFLASTLGIDVKQDCKSLMTHGVGGKSKVYLAKNNLLVKIGDFERKVPVGFLDNNYIPPLLGRQKFLETFKVIFDKHSTTFE